MVSHKGKKSPKISVLVPVCNVEKYLPECLESILNQTIKNIEIICINDGSKDNSLEILKEYANKDSRIRIIDKENSGYGDSMNRGLIEACGEYIGIVESDDFISDDMFEVLYALSKNGTVDIIKGNFYDYYDKPGKVPDVVKNMERQSIEDSEFPFTLKENPQISWGHPSVWSAIYKRSFIEENNIRFIPAPGGGWVDNPFFYETLCKAKSIMWTSKPLYYYRKTNATSSSNSQSNPVLPFERMMDNLDVLEENHALDRGTLRCAYARALMYLNGALMECDYDKNFKIINEKAKELMQRLNPDVILEDFNLRDQYNWLKWASPFKSLGDKSPKILLYNWVPFDNPWKRGGGVTVYCQNLIAEILKENPEVNIYFLSSGFAYSAVTTKTFIRKLDSKYGDRVHQFEVVNSPIPAEQSNIFRNPLIALENQKLKEIISEFIQHSGPFEVIHFNNIEGISLDILDLKEQYPETRFIYSIHNYVPMCVTGFYYMRHKHCNCNPKHTGEDCIKCTRKLCGNNFAVEQYKRGIWGQDPQKCISQKRWINELGFQQLDEDVSEEYILDFAKTATQKINKNCDYILAVSKRVFDIAAENGFDTDKMHVSYIGTKVAEKQIGHAAYDAIDGLKVVFLGNDINYEEKGYPFLLDTLSDLDPKYAARIDLVLTVRQAEHAEIYTMLKNFRSIKVIQGYTHDDLEDIFKGCNLSLVPVLWEDNLPQIAIESVAYGVPVLTSSAGGASELCDCELFRFECGNSKDFCDKIIHFVDHPEDLKEYWNYHHGLMTMSRHWKELAEYYGIDTADSNLKLEITKKDYYFMRLENEFLRNNISLNDEKFTPNPVMEDLKKQLREAKEKNKRMREELENMQNRRGKITFQTEYNPVQGHVGAEMFQITLKDFEWNNFYAEIKFVHLENVSASHSDTLVISGTLRSQNGKKTLTLHQYEWKEGRKELTDYIYYYIRENSIVFFARYPGRSCGYDWEIQTMTSRAEGDTVEYKMIHNGFIYENEGRAKDAVNKL